MPRIKVVVNGIEVWRRDPAPRLNANGRDVEANTEIYTVAESPEIQLYIQADAAYRTEKCFFTRSGRQALDNVGLCFFLTPEAAIQGYLARARQRRARAQRELENYEAELDRAETFAAEALRKGGTRE